MKITRTNLYRHPVIDDEFPRFVLLFCSYPQAWRVLFFMFLLFFVFRARAFLIYTTWKGEKFNWKGEKFNWKGEKFNWKGEKFNWKGEVKTA
jgi:hypothetical protein